MSKYIFIVYFACYLVGLINFLLHYLKLLKGEDKEGYRLQRAFRNPTLGFINAIIGLWIFPKVGFLYIAAAVIKFLLRCILFLIFLVEFAMKLLFGVLEIIKWSRKK